MALLRNRTDRIGRVEARIERLRRRAGKLLVREQQARSERRGTRFRERRERMVENEVRAILGELQQQSQRTRLRLDRELARLAPIEDEWERLGDVFDRLDETLAEPSLEALGARWRGELEIPEFPVREHEEYLRPFPRGAIVF
jgi:hypothetical protein